MGESEMSWKLGKTPDKWQLIGQCCSTVCQSSNVSKNRFDLVSTVGQTFGRTT